MMSDGGPHPRGQNLLVAALGLAGIILLLLGGTTCYRWFRIEVTDPSEALIPVEGRKVPLIEDDLDRRSLRRAIHRSLSYLARLAPDQTFAYGPRRVRVWQVQGSLLAFLRCLNDSPTDQALARRLREEFQWFKAAGRDVFRRVLFTGYFEPQLEGRLEPRGEFQFPLYRRPTDLVEVDLGLFRSQLNGLKLAGRLAGGSLIPYFTRAEIDGQKALAGRDLELVWLRDPVDRFFLHVQGSGQVLLEDGRRLRVHYAGSNGHPYRSIGRLLVEEGAIPREKMSMQAIRAYLLDHPHRIEEILFANPSYIFFRKVDEGPLGSIDVPLTPGRSIATDGRLFPKGGLAFVQSKKPDLDRQGNIRRWRPFCRFVLNQDTGGAIRGAGRVDLFCGSAREAEIFAGHLQHEGKLFFLLWKGV